jgi:imidazole glycerol phosphate synthase glutamine amidotransferase subunit
VRLVLVDYGAGNLPSVERAFARLGAATVRCRDHQGLAGADAIVLPGVGHFGALADGLDRGRLRGAIAAALAAGVPFLGICLGMQALYATSEEAPGATGLGIFPGAVRALPRSVKLPHMGWNTTRREGGPARDEVAGRSSLLRGVEDAWFYFAHAYAAPAGDPWISASCDYGPGFAAVVQRGNVMGVQFHPEKSGTAGIRVLSNFLEFAS